MMLTICLIASIITLALALACVTGLLASIVFVLFGDVLIVTFVIIGIVKARKHFKNKKFIKNKK